MSDLVQILIVLFCLMCVMMMFKDKFKEIKKDFWGDE